MVLMITLLIFSFNIVFADDDTSVDEDISNLHGISLNVNGDVDIGSFGSDTNTEIGNTIIEKIKTIVKYFHAIAIIVVIGFLIKYIIAISIKAGDQSPQSLDLAKKGLIYSLLSLFLLGSLYYWINLSFYSGQSLRTNLSASINNLYLNTNIFRNRIL